MRTVTDQKFDLTAWIRSRGCDPTRLMRMTKVDLRDLAAEVQRATVQQIRAEIAALPAQELWTLVDQFEVWDRSVKAEERYVRVVDLQRQ